MADPVPDLSSLGGSTPLAPRSPWADVPWRTIVATIGVVAVVVIVVALLDRIGRVLTWGVIAGFFAVVLSRPVGEVERRVGGRRNVAVTIVLFTTLAIILGTIALFVLPVRTQLAEIVGDLPGTVSQAADGRGPAGELVTKLGLTSLVSDNEERLRDVAEDLSSFAVLASVVQVTFGVVSVFVMTFLLLSQAAAMGRAAERVIPHRYREMARRAGSNAARAVSGYMLGNLLISVVAGTAALTCLLILRVPSPLVLALFVAVADLIPLVGATLGAAVASVAAFLHSPSAGVVAIIFFVAYQQLENNVIQVWVMSRTVKVNPLVVLLSVLVGIETFGFLGALLAIPIAGAVQVASTTVMIERRRSQLLVEP